MSSQDKIQWQTKQNCPPRFRGPRHGKIAITFSLSFLAGCGILVFLRMSQMGSR